MQDTATKPVATFAALPTAAMLLDQKGLIVNMNNALARLFGYKKADLMGEPAQHLLEKPKARSPFAKPSEYGKTWQTQAACLHKTGRTIYCQVHGTFFAAKQHTVITLCDITEFRDQETALLEEFASLSLKAKEQTTMLNIANQLLEHNISERDSIDKALRDNEKRFRLLAENSTDIVSQQTPDYKYLYVSPACKPLLGYTSKEMVGKKSTDFIHSGDLKKIQGEKGLDSDNTLTYRIRKKDGNYTWFETTIRHILKENGEVIEIHATSRDITARISDERARQRTQKLAQVFRLNTMEEMASGMAHEINQPLAAVVNYTQGCIRHLEKDDMEKNKKLIEVMGKASEQAKRAGEIIHRLKNFFAKGKLYKSPEKSGRLIRESIKFIKDEIEKANVNIKYKLGTNLPYVSVDKIQVQQVILNLTHNAIEAMCDIPENNRKITIKTRLLRNKFIEFTFTDTGPGFPDEVADKIFQSFFTTKPKGTGMGLPISRSIIEAHGGKFSIVKPSGNADGGVCFTLPISEKKRRKPCTKNP